MRGGSILVALVMVFAATAVADSVQQSGSNAGEEISWQVVSSGGGGGTSAGLIINSTVGQTAAGLATVGLYDIHHGFWQDFGAGSCCTLGGDANNDGKVAIGDAVFIITYVYRGGPAPVCPEEADVTGNGEIGVGDAVYIITYIFRLGPAPICP
ncbi:MAG: hypothetical protein GYA46_01120 [candidate division Zixibacteria bacterium]|nr:hypothetical protein [candidate division Zixibacteria bacterium]